MKILPIPAEVLHDFGYSNGQPGVRRNYDGLINTTFFIEGRNSKIVLQKMNQAVFKNPAAIQLNYEKVFAYLRQHGNGILLPEPVLGSKGGSFFIDKEGGFWRAFYYIGNSAVKHCIASKENAYAVAEFFRRLLKVLQHFPAKGLQDAIPDFHNLAFRYRQFTEALVIGKAERKANAAVLVEALQHRQKYVGLYNEIVSGKVKFPVRVLHHDAKVANILFDIITGEVLCAVDFDTLMPGYFFSGFGDMVRASACSAGEEETNFSKVFINKEYFEALLNGYLSEAGDILTESERPLLIYSGHLLIYMQALRFATDYLLGDIYYRTTYASHNFNRAMNQLTLLRSLEGLVPATIMAT